MASLPSPTQVSGKHNAIYEAYYKQIDPKGVGTIEAMDAAKFLKKSGLSDVVLSRIWDLSDPKGRGCLDKAGVFVALKLVALAQHGHDINMRNIFMEPPNPPKVGEIPKIMPQAIQSVPASNTDWSMKPTDRIKYEQLFDSLQPVNGLIAGNKVKGVLMDSRLPLETLGRIWDLADQDKDGSLDKHEFTVAMHLVYQALDKRAVPTTLPPELQKPPKTNSIPKAPSGEGFNDGGFVANFPKDIAPPVAMPPLVIPVSSAPPAINSIPQQNVTSIPLISNVSTSSSKTGTSTAAVTSGLDWIVTPQDRIRFEVIFRDCDKDKDGLVCGLEVKNVFLKSGVPQNCLAHIWALCDTNQSGKLTLEQFALAMWMVEQKMKGIEPPEVLTPNMIPPSLRGVVSGVEIPLAQPEPQQPRYSNPELEMIAKEIDELFKEKSGLETDIAQKEADIRIKTGEIRSLQSELDTLAATLKQLENQKGEAQKRLDDLTTQVGKIREQCQKQEETINQQEGELNSKRSELQKLKDEESAFDKELESLRKEVDNLSKQLQDKQLESSQVKAMITELLENQRQMNDAILLCKAAIESNDAYLVSDYSLKTELNFREAKEILEKIHEPPKTTTADPFNETTNNDDGFGDNKHDAFALNGFTSDPFGSAANENKLKNNTGGGFDDSFMNAPLSGFDDAFSSSFSSTAATNQTKDPFTSSNVDPFGDKKASNVTNEPGKDDFGSDPFAILHAPTSGGQILSPNLSSSQKSGPPPRPESPSPALPPKKSKQPPPRPAPPRPLQGPTRPAPPAAAATDSFGSSSGGFADFADFDNKQSVLPKPILYPLSTRDNLQKKIKSSSTTNTTSSSASSFKAKSSVTTVNSTTTKTIAATTSRSVTGTAPTDFVDDPFKDYRYEDPFNIKDPFDDNDDNVGDGYHGDDDFKDNSASDDNSKSFVGNYKPFPQNEDSDEKDFFETFDDNFKKFDNKTDKAKTMFDNDKTTAFDAAFGNLSNTQSTNKSKSSTATKTFDYNFDDDFGDDFNKTKVTTNNNNNNITNNTIGVTASINETNTTTTTSATNSNLNEDFASFDAFENATKNMNKNYSFINNNNNNNKSNIKNDINSKNNELHKFNANKMNEMVEDSNSKPNKISSEFVNDYSKPDTFDDDLQAAIQRSLVEK